MSPVRHDCEDSALAAMLGLKRWLLACRVGHRHQGGWKNRVGGAHRGLLDVHRALVHTHHWCATMLLPRTSPCTACAAPQPSSVYWPASGLTHETSLDIAWAAPRRGGSCTDVKSSLQDCAPSLPLPACDLVLPPSSILRGSRLICDAAAQCKYDKCHPDQCEN